MAAVAVAMLAATARGGEPPRIVTDDEVARVEALLADEPRGYSIPITDRVVCDSPAFRDRFGQWVERAEAMIAHPVPAWRDEDYLLFKKTGNRAAAGKMMGARTTQLMPCVLAECVENKGRFVGHVNALLEDLAEKGAWVQPSSDRDLANFNRTRFSIDLVSAALAADLSQALWIMGDRIRPEVRAKVMAALEARIFEPMRTRGLHYRWSVDKRFWWINSENNWNPVCWSGVTIAATTLCEDRRFRAEIVAGAEKMSKAYLAGYAEDGTCREGMGYWNYGFSKFLALREAIWQATDGRVELLDADRATAIARYGFDFSLLHGLAPAFGDCKEGLQAHDGILAYCNQVLGLGRNVPPFCPVGDPVAGRGLFGAPASFIARSPAAPIMTEGGAPIHKGSPSSSVYADGHVMISRNADRTFAAAVKAGGNWFHSHDDMGSYIIQIGKDVVAGDPGGPDHYTGDTFGPKRHDHVLINSLGHPVMVVAGKAQRQAVDSGGKPLVEPVVMERRAADAGDLMRIDLRDVYDVEAELLERVYEFDRRTTSVRIEDRFALKAPETFATAVISRGVIEEDGKGGLRLARGEGRLAVEIAASAAYSIEVAQLEDHGVAFSRALISLKEKSREGFIQTTFAKP